MITKKKLKWLAQNGAKLIDSETYQRPNFTIEKNKWFFEMPNGMVYSYEYISDASMEDIQNGYMLHS